MDPYLCARLVVFGFCCYGAWRYTKATALASIPPSGEVHEQFHAEPIIEPQEPVTASMPEPIPTPAPEAPKQRPRPKKAPEPEPPDLLAELTSQKFRDGDEWKPWDKLDAAYQGRAALSFLRKKAEERAKFPTVCDARQRIS